MPNTFSLWFSFVADVLSILGFGVAVYSAIKIRALSRWYIFRIEGRRIADKIGTHVDNLRDLRVEYDENYDSIRFVLAECQPALASLQGKLPLFKQLRLWKISRRLQKLNGGESLGKEPFESLYLELVSIRQVIHHLLEDSQWER